MRLDLLEPPLLVTVAEGGVCLPALHLATRGDRCYVQVSRAAGCNHLRWVSSADVRPARTASGPAQLSGAATPSGPAQLSGAAMPSAHAAPSAAATSPSATGPRPGRTPPPAPRGPRSAR